MERKQSAPDLNMELFGLSDQRNSTRQQPRRCPTFPGYCEPGPSCKVFLQASLEGSELYQSPTQRFTRWVWVYAVPIIICTNDWIHENDNSPLARWIRENQVFVHVTSPMFET